jgi:hypothetical protein
MQIATVLAPLFLCSGIGFVWARVGYRFDSQMITRLVTTVAVPCLSFSSLTRLSVSSGQFALIGGIFLVALGCLAAIGFVAIRLAHLDFRVYGPTMVFANCVNMGLAVCLFAFGEAGLALGVSIAVVNAVLSYTLGVAVFAGELSFRSLSRNTLIYATLAAIGFMVTGAAPPRWLADTTSFLGALAIPYMLVALGTAIARLTVSDLPQAIALSLLRQLSGFGVGWGLAALLGLGGIARGVLIVQCAMPSQVLNYLFAQRYQRRPEQVAGMVLATTLISYAMLPLVLMAVLPGT